MSGDDGTNAGTPRAGVLSRLEIKRLSEPAEFPLISRCQDEIAAPAAYDLRAGYIITADHYLELKVEHVENPARQRDFRLLLKAGETATLASYEKLNLPPFVNGVIVPRDTYAKRGLLTLNAGHIDPGFRGFVTAQVVNLTNRPFPLDLGESYFRQFSLT